MSEDELEFIGRAAPREKAQDKPQEPEPSEYDYSHLEGVVDPEIIELFKADDRRRRESGEGWEDGD